MTKQTAIGAGVGAVAIAGILIYFIMHTLSDQAATQQQLDALKKQIAASTTPSAPPSPTSAATQPSMINAAVTTQDGSVMAKQKATQEYLTEGFRLLNTRDRDNARRAAKVFQEGLEKVDATNVYFHNGLGRALLLTGDNAEALKAFENAQKVDPMRAELVSGAGWAHWNLKEYAQAKTSWEDALKLDPNSQDAWMALSWVYLAMGEDEKSRQGFVILLKIDSASKEWTTGLSMARAGNHNIDQIRTQFKGMPDPTAFPQKTP